MEEKEYAGTYYKSLLMKKSKFKAMTNKLLPQGNGSHLGPVVSAPVRSPAVCAANTTNILTNPPHSVKKICALLIDHLKLKRKRSHLPPKVAASLM